MPTTHCEVAVCGGNDGSLIGTSTLYQRKKCFAMQRAALYIRVSSDEQAKHGYSLGEQKADLQAYAESMGYKVVGIYADEGATARKAIRSRKGLQKLLQDVQSKKIDIILIKCLDRWFRNVRDFYRVQDILDSSNVVWECTQEKYNTKTTEGRLLLNMKLSIAQHESDLTGDRIRYIQEGMRRRRMPLGGAIPAGYKAENKQIVVDEEKAPIVRFAYSHVAGGGSLSSLVPLIRDKFGVSFTRRQIHLLVRNRSYLGEFYGVEGYAEPIIDKRLFERVQAIVSTNRRFPSGGRPYLFSGLIVCPCCGNRLQGQRGTKDSNGEYRWHMYRCNNHVQNHKCEYSTAISEGRLERWLLANIKSCLKERLYRVRRGITKTDNTKQELCKCKEKLRRLKDLYVEEVIELDDYKRDYKSLKDKIAELERQSMQSHALPPTAQEVLDMDDFIEKYKQLSQQRKAKLWHSIIESISFERKPLKRNVPLDFKVTFLP